MPDLNPIQDVETSLALIDDIAKEGREGDLLSRMTKGFRDLGSNLLDLLKGRKAPPPPPKKDDKDGDEDEGADDTSEETDQPADPPEPPERGREGDEPPPKKDDEEEDEGDGKPGFDDVDMNKGKLDVTDFFLALPSHLEAQRERLAAQGKEMVTLRKGLAHSQAQGDDLRALLVQQGERIEALIGAFASNAAAQGGAVTTLQKGVMALEVSLAHTPGSTPGLSGRAAAIRHNLDEAARNNTPPTPPAFPKERLMKAMNSGVITGDEMLDYQRTGAFCTDAARNQHVTAKVAAIQ